MKIPKRTLNVAHDGLLAETEKAILLLIDGDEKWIPRSQVGLVYNKHAEVSEWWVLKEGLDPYIVD